MSRLEAKPRAALALIVLLAVGLRVINLSARTLWYDEAFSVLFARQGWQAMVDGTLIEEDDGSAADVHPLLYYQSLHYWMDVFGESVAAVRLFSVLAGVATIPVVFLLVRDWFGRRTALAAALIVAVAPFHVQYSQEARMYALLALVLTLATWAYWRAWQHDRAWDWVAFGVLAGVSMYVQQLAAPVLLALGLLPVLARRRDRVVRTGLAALLALVVYLPWLIYLPRQLAKLRRYWVQRPNVLHLWLALRSFVSVNLDFSAVWWLPTFLLAAVFTVFLVYRGYGVLRDSRLDAGDREPVRWALWLAFMPMIFMWVVSYLLQPVFLPRALLPSAVVFYVAVAWLLVSAGIPRLIVGGLAVWWSVIVVFGLVTLYGWDTFPAPPFDDADSYLANHVEAGDVIVHGNKITVLPMIYYDRDLPQAYVRDIPSSGSDTLGIPTQQALGLMAQPCIAGAAHGAPRVWYVTFDRLEDEMAELVADNPNDARYDSLRWLRAHYTQVMDEDFNDLIIYLFTGPDADAMRARCEPE